MFHLLHVVRFLAQVALLIPALHQAITLTSDQCVFQVRNPTGMKHRHRAIERQPAQPIPSFSIFLSLPLRSFSFRSFSFRSLSCGKPRFSRSWRKRSRRSSSRRFCCSRWSHSWSSTTGWPSRRAVWRSDCVTRSGHGEGSKPNIFSNHSYNLGRHSFSS